MAVSIERPRYLARLVEKRENGLVKVITGPRRCGKSYLLFNLFRNYLITSGVDATHIVEIALDDLANASLRNPFELDRRIRDLVSRDGGLHYVFLDEIQNVHPVQNPHLDVPDATVGFTDVLLGLMKLPNVDLYVTGSNSKMLSFDILTEFRDRGDEIRINPLTFSEFNSVRQAPFRDAWAEYRTYGGMPRTLLQATHEGKSNYLKNLLTRTYISDVIERNKLQGDRAVLDDLLNFVASSIGALTNPTRLANTFQSVKHLSISHTTVGKYLDCFVDAFLIAKAHRYDVKGKAYIDTPLKYYFTDVGIRNASLGFRQQEDNHIMENVLYNELFARGFDIDVGVVEHNCRTDSGRSARTQLEVDFVANKGSKRYYIQSAYELGTPEKREQETRSLRKIPDSFAKIVVVNDALIPWHDEAGILYLGIEQFLTDERAIDL